MTPPRQRHTLFTKEEYWFREEGSIDHHEYFRGEVFAMAGATPRHNDIALSIASSLRSQLQVSIVAPA